MRSRPRPKLAHPRRLCRPHLPHPSGRLCLRRRRHHPARCPLLKHCPNALSSSTRSTGASSRPRADLPTLAFTSSTSSAGSEGVLVVGFDMRLMTFGLKSMSCPTVLRMQGGSRMQNLMTYMSGIAAVGGGFGARPGRERLVPGAALLRQRWISDAVTWF